MRSIGQPLTIVFRIVAFSAIVLSVATFFLARQDADAHDINILAATPFSALDGVIGTDHDGVANGTFTVSDGDLIIGNGGSITCNDPAAPANSSACPIKIDVTGAGHDLIMACNSAILAQNTTSGGNGGNITITVDGEVKLDGPCAAGGGPKISSSRSGGGSGQAGDIAITADGNFSMNCGSSVLSENTGAEGAGAISITSGGDVTLIGGCGAGAGPLISSSKTGNMDAFDAGDISIIANGPSSDVLIGLGARVIADSKHTSGKILIKATQTITIDGLVSSGYDYAGATTNSRGESITIDAGCTVTITGTVSSKGRDKGADLVHIEGCDVFIFGLVESTAVGHANPGNDCNAPARGGKPSEGDATTCVEVWAGGELVINSIGANAGQVSADHFGASALTGWIDLFAREDIRILNDQTGPFSVHANQGTANTQPAMYITIKSIEGNVEATGKALQSGVLNGGNDGGHIVIQAAQTVDLDTATLEAIGDYVREGGFGFGGTMKIRSFAGNLTWQNGIGDVRPTGADTIVTAGNPADFDAPSAASGKRGVITLENCTGGSVTTAGSSFPFLGDMQTTPQTTNVGVCGGAPSLPTVYTVTLPICDCGPRETPSDTPPVTQTITPPVTQTITPPVTQTITPPVTVTITPPVTVTITPPVTLTITPPVTLTITPPVTETITPPVTQTITPPVTETITPPVTQTITPPVTQTITPPVTQTITPPVTQTITPPVTQTITPPVTQTITPPVTTTVTPVVTPPSPTVGQETQTPVRTTTPPTTTTPPPTSPTNPPPLPATSTPKVLTPTPLRVTQLPNSGGPGDQTAVFAWVLVLAGAAAMVVGISFGVAAGRFRDD